MVDFKHDESYDEQVRKAIAKYSFPETCHACTLLEQVLVDQELDVSELYPGMQQDPLYTQTLYHVQNLKLRAQTNQRDVTDKK